MRQPDAADGLIPLVIGVTGHRDLLPSDVPGLESAVRKLLKRIKAERSHSPLLVLTPLAEGADRLVARVALELGAELAIALPFPIAEYERDFANDASRIEFTALLNHPRTVRRIVLPAIMPGQADARPDARSLRDLQYLLTGTYVARYSTIMIALWDGLDSTDVGGTADVVAFRRSGTLPKLSADHRRLLASVPEPFGVPHESIEPPSVGSVYHLLTARQGQLSPEGVGMLHVLKPVVQGSEADRGGAAMRVDDFNRDATDLFRTRPRQIEQSRQQLFPMRDAEHAGDSLSPDLRPLRNAFALADVLAITNQRRTYGTLLGLFALVFFAALCFQTYAHFASERQTAFLAAYVVLIAVADGLYLLTRYRRTQDDFQDYRATAEGFRIQFYWRLAGIDLFASDHYLHKQRDELAWVCEAIRAWGVRCPTASDADGDPRGALETLWVGGQRQYFTNAARLDRIRLVRLQMVASGLVMASLLWALARALGRSWSTSWSTVGLMFGALAVFVTHGVLRVRGEGDSNGLMGFLAGFGLGTVVVLTLLTLRYERHWTAEAYDAFFFVANGLMALGGAFLNAYADKRAMAPHTRQYARMAEVFARAASNLSSIGESASRLLVRRVCVALGKESLSEHADWVLLHRERPLELPTAEM